MAKKKHKKKHNFQHKNAPVAAVATAAPVDSAAKATSKVSTMPNEWAEVSADVRRSLVLAGVFIAIMIGLAIYLDGTAAGAALYKSIKF